MLEVHVPERVWRFRSSRPHHLLKQRLPSRIGGRRYPKRRTRPTLGGDSAAPPANPSGHIAQRVATQRSSRAACRSLSLIGPLQAALASSRRLRGDFSEISSCSICQSGERSATSHFTSSSPRVTDPVREARSLGVHSVLRSSFGRPGQPPPFAQRVIHRRRERWSGDRERYAHRYFTRLI
jgi:hypothetical protein